MLYAKLVVRIAEVTGVPEEEVRRVLSAFPDVIMEGEEGEQTKTPLGTFRLVRRKRKRVKDPQGRWTCSKERLDARIRPGKRLQRGPDEEPKKSEPFEDPDEPNVLSLFSTAARNPAEDP